MATSLDKDSEHADLKSLLERYQECATYLMQNCQKINHVPGAVKLERKCAAELKYLRSLSKRRGDFNITHLRSSNLGHYAGIIHSVENLPDVTHILQAFSCPGRTDALHMDVVAYNGHAWIKVIARNAQAIHLTWAGKSLYACQTSVDSFNSIIDTLGGQSETSRGKELLSWITVIPDNPSFRASTLPNTGKLKDRSKVIFGTGDSLRAVTATANSGFIRAAERQGVTFSAFVHEARALIESKEATAEPLSRET